jgi:hypothetical protein
LYFVPDLKGMLSSILRALATPGLFLAAMAGRANSLAQFCLRCFDLIGKPFPFRTSEDFEAALASLGEAYCTEDVHYALIFPDVEEHRLSIGRFLLGSDYDAVPRWAMLESFDSYANAGKIAMPLVHKHFMVRNFRRHREARVRDRPRQRTALDMTGDAHDACPPTKTYRGFVANGTDREGLGLQQR